MNQLAKWSSNFDKHTVSHFVNNFSSLCSIEVLTTALKTTHNLHNQQPGPSNLKRRDLNFSRFMSMLFPITSFQYYSPSLHFNIIPHHFISILFSITSFQYYSHHFISILFPSLNFNINLNHFISILLLITSFQYYSP
jgi:hypothetical protein